MLKYVLLSRAVRMMKAIVCSLNLLVLASFASLGQTVGQTVGQTAEKPAQKLPGMGITKGPISADIVPDALWDGRKIVAFHAIDLPKMVKAADADFIEPSEYVLGVTVEGQSRAYPSRFIGWHHIINDKVTVKDSAKDSTKDTTKGAIGESKDRWYAVTYCSVCNTGIRYNLSLNEKPIKLDFYGLYNGVVTLCDRESESVFLQASGRFVSGALMGKELGTEPVLDTTWGEWKRLHPDTLIMSPDTEYTSHYRTKGAIVQRGNTRFGMPVFQASLTRADKRLPRFDKVLGVSLPQAGSVTPANSKTAGLVLRRAYPIKTVTEAGGVVNDTLGDSPIAVFLDPATISACAVSRRLDGKTLTFEARKSQDGDGKIAFYDKETGTRWNIEGKGEEGLLAGKSLERMDAHLSQWYGWYAYYPETTIYGNSDSQQPIDPAEATGETVTPAKP